MGKRKDILILFFGILILFSLSNVSANWVNASDEFNVSQNGVSITTNLSQGKPTDFWVLSNTQSGYINHYNSTGGNFTGVSLTDSDQVFHIGGGSSINAITRNSSGDFWVMNFFISSPNPMIFSHLNKTGGNMTGGFSTFLTSSNVLGSNIERNSSGDFWYLDDAFMYHINSLGINQTDGFKVLGNLSQTVSFFGNNSDFWILANAGACIPNVGGSCIYHLNRSGDDQGDGFAVSGTPLSITSNISSGSPTDFWFYTSSTKRISHYFNDIINPSINITFPINNTLTANTNVNYTKSDNGVGVIDSVWYSNDTYTINLSLGSGGTYFNITNITWSPGQHNVTIYVNDTAGNLNFSTISFTIDSQAPNISITTPFGIFSSLTVPFNVSMSDNIALGSCIYWINRGASIEVANTSITCGANVNGTFIVSSDLTNYIFNIWANDSVGNANYTNSSFSTGLPAPVLQSGGGGGGGPPATTPQNQTIKTFCGDNICQPLNNYGVKEDFYSCPVDCKGANIDNIFAAFTSNCFDNNPATICFWTQSPGNSQVPFSIVPNVDTLVINCISSGNNPCFWNSIMASYLILGSLGLIFVLSFAKIKTSQGRVAPTRYIYLKIKNRKRRR